MLACVRPLDFTGRWPDPPLTDLMEGRSLLAWLRGEQSGPSAEVVITEKIYPNSDHLQIGLRSGGYPEVKARLRALGYMD